MEPDALVRAWMDAASSGAYSSDGTVVVKCFKNLMGLVHYYQGTSKYLGVVLIKIILVQMIITIQWNTTGMNLLDILVHQQTT